MMMFGLCGVVFVIYYIVKFEYKKVVGGLMLFVVFILFLIGIIEFLEFSFLFVVFIFYVIYVFFDGLVFMMVDIFNIIIG